MMKIAIPCASGMLCMHFGHCEEFAVVHVNKATKEIERTDRLTPPPHEPGVLPAWLAEQGASHIIAGGMGMRAQQLFSQHNIEVMTGAPALPPETLVNALMSGSLECGANTCDH